MTTSTTMPRPSKPRSRDKIPASQLAYIKTRTKLRMFELVHQELRKSGLTQAELAARLGKGTDRISRILGAPGNWTLDTASELLFAISGGTLDPAVSYPLAADKRSDAK